MMKKAVIFTLSALVLFTLSCRRSDHVDSSSSDIVFSAFLYEGDSIRPFSTVSKALSGDLASGYALSGTLTSAPYLTEQVASRTRFQIDQLMNADGTPKDARVRFQWSKYDNNYHSFTAYSLNPAGTASGDGVLSVQRRTTGTGEDVFVAFNQPADPAKQIDLLTAESMDLRVNVANRPSVRLFFSHRLSKVGIRVFGSDGAVLTGCQATITYGPTTVSPVGRIGDASIDGLSTMRGGGNSYEYAPDRLQTNVRYDGTYDLGGTFGISASNTSVATAVKIGDLILLPQDLAAEWAELTVSYNVDGRSKTVSCHLPAFELRATMESVISVNIIESASELQVMGVSVNPWGTPTSHVVDGLPGFYTLSVSPRTQSIPSNGKWALTVTSNSRWLVGSSTAGLVLDKSSGSSGTTQVVATIPESGDNFEIFFSTIGDDATRKTARAIGLRHDIIVNPSAPTANIPRTGGTYTVDVMSVAIWTSSCAVNGVTWSPTTGGEGATRVTITVPENLTPTARPVPIVFATTNPSGETKTTAWTGNQDAALAPSISLDRENANVPGNGGSYTVQVTSSSAWNAATFTSGVTMNPASGSAGVTSVVITVPTNPDASSSRYVTVSFTAIIAGRPYTATWLGEQAPAPPLSLDIEQVNIPANGGSYTVQVTSAGSWNASMNPSTISMNPQSGSAGVTSVVITVPANTTSTEQFNTVTFVAVITGKVYTAGWLGNQSAIRSPPPPGSYTPTAELAKWVGPPDLDAH